LTPEESKTAVVDLDAKQRETLFRDFAQRKPCSGSFAAYQRASEASKATAQERVPVDAKGRKALFQEFADYRETTQ
jgi:hypothetical protein